MTSPPSTKGPTAITATGSGWTALTREPWRHRSLAERGSDPVPSRDRSSSRRWTPPPSSRPEPQRRSTIWATSSSRCLERDGDSAEAQASRSDHLRGRQDGLAVTGGRDGHRHRPHRDRAAPAGQRRAIRLPARFGWRRSVPRLPLDRSRPQAARGRRHVADPFGQAPLPFSRGCFQPS
jgi:hypothetical protein